MTTQPTTPKRWRPRFSVRTLVVFVSLVCYYAACWATQRIFLVSANEKGISDLRLTTKHTVRQS